MRCSLWLAVAVSSCATPALGAVVTVSQNGPLTTIQAGVDAAGAGDVVVVKAGTYSGSVVVPAGRDGLLLKAKGNVVLDARGPLGIAIGAGMELNSTNVVVKGFLVRNAESISGNAGDGIRANGAGCRIERSTVTGCTSSGVFANASNVVVKSSKLSINDFGFDTGANLAGIVVTKTMFEFNEDRAGNLGPGTSVKFEKCRVRGGARGFRGSLQGANDGTTFVNCTFEGMVSSAVSVNGTDIVVAQCVVKRGGGGIVLSGANGVVRDTLIDGAASNSSALFVFDATGFVIEDNVFVGTGGSAIELSATTSSCSLSGNVAKKCVPSNSRAAYAIRGVGHELRDERIIDTGGDGFGALGDGLVFVECSALRCGRDGFDVDANGVTLEDCDARQCKAEGLDNAGTSTLVDGGLFLQNRIDIANNGAITLDGVTFVTGGANVVAQLD